MLKLRYIYAFIVFIWLLLWMFFKTNTGYFSPDELFYTSRTEYLGEIDNLSFNFYITKLYFTKLYEINQFLPVVVQIILALYVFVYISKHSSIINKRLSIAIFLLFLLPSFSFYTVAYLRDIYALLVCILLLFNNIEKSDRIKIKRDLVLIFIICLLRYEVGLLIAILYLFDRYMTVFFRLFLRNNVSLFVMYIATMFFVALTIVSSESIWNLFSTTVLNYEKSTTGFGFFQVPLTKENFIIYYPLNSLSYYGSYIYHLFSKGPLSSFDIIMIIDSAICIVLFIRVFAVFRVRFFKEDKFYRISVYLLLLSIPLSLIESLPSTSIRHRLVPLVFLFYINIYSFIYKKSY